VISAINMKKKICTANLIRGALARQALWLLPFMEGPP
jgi:hypothetical protein